MRELHRRILYLIRDVKEQYYSDPDSYAEAGQDLYQLQTEATKLWDSLTRQSNLN